MEHQDINRLLDANMHILSTPNVVRIDYGTKVVDGVDTGRPALVVGVIKKLSPSEIQAPDLVVPASITFDSPSGRVELETDVVEEGEIVALHTGPTPPIPGGTLVKTDGINGGGSLGVNITYDGTYRLLSCAHVLTAFDPSFVGKTVNYCEDDWKNPKALATVTGMAPVTYYTSSSQQNPTRNRQDLAWADITQQLGAPNIVSIGTPAGLRAPTKLETLNVYGGFTQSKDTTKVLSLTARTTVKSIFSDNSTIYTFWDNVIQLDAGQLSLLPGDSGSALVATSDNKVVGLAFSTGTIYAYGCLLV